MCALVPGPCGRRTARVPLLRHADAARSSCQLGSESLGTMTCLVSVCDAHRCRPKFGCESGQNAAIANFALCCAGHRWRNTVHWLRVGLAKFGANLRIEPTLCRLRRSLPEIQKLWTDMRDFDQFFPISVEFRQLRLR